jgi:hypothetical protein
VPSGIQKRPPESLTFEIRLDDGSLVLGGVQLDAETLILTVNSRTRSDLGRTLDRHYRDLLDQPIPMLGNKSPRVAAKTASGRTKVVDWLKMVENHRKGRRPQSRHGELQLQLATDGIGRR